MTQKYQEFAVPSASSRRSRGYILLAVLLLLAALVLLVAMAQQRAGDEDVSGALMRSDARALAIAEVGLERTRAYLGALIERDADLDRALDPGLDTDCTLLPMLGGNTVDDHLPAFTDGARVIAPSSGKPYLLVPSGDGAYFVRLDDNDDDAQDLPLLAPTTSNNPSGSCLEGLMPGGARTNPVRDRDGMVWVTVIGVHPGTSLEQADARRTLRVLVGPGETAGVIAGGTVRMQGASHVCGAFGDVVATGSIQGGCLCGAGCSSGPPWNSCGAGNACSGLSGGPECSASSGGSGGECAAGVPVSSPPRVSPWDIVHAPLGCTGAPCVPFYYLRLDDAAQARLHAWNYAACASPRSGPRICGPADCPSCWVTLDATHKDLDIQVSDKDPGLRSTTPTLSIASRDAPLVWHADGLTGYDTGVLGCEAKDTGVYPGSVGFRSRDMRRVTFEYRADPKDPHFARLPRGVWFVEGNVLFRGFDTPNCAALSEDPTYGASIIATGNILHEAGSLAFRPASPRGVALLAGRDLRFSSGSARLFTCGASAAVMAHEQFEMGASAHLEAQLVVENASRCSNAVSGDAIRLSGDATVSVPKVPPVSMGQPASVRLLSESAY